MTNSKKDYYPIYRNEPDTNFDFQPQKNEVPYYPSDYRAVQNDHQFYDEEIQNNPQFYVDKTYSSTIIDKENFFEIILFPFQQFNLHLKTSPFFAGYFCAILHLLLFCSLTSFISNLFPF